MTSPIQTATLREALAALAEWPCQKYNPPHDCGRVTGNAPLPCGPCTARAALEAESRADLLAQIEKAVLALEEVERWLDDNLPNTPLHSMVLAAIRSAAPVEPES